MKIKKYLKNMIKKLILVLYHGMRLLPVKKNRIVIESSIGRNFTGNPKAIYESMVESGFCEGKDIYVILEDVQTKIDGPAKKIKRNRLRFFYVLATAKVWISDSRFPAYIVKRKQTRYIQTWHGTPLKKLALDMDDVFMAGEKSIEDYKDKFAKNSATWDYLISQNHFSSEVFRRAFAFQKEMLEIGYPRNDILFSGNHAEYILKLKQKMGLPLDKKIILYAPTWRDDEFYDFGKYKFSPKLDFDALYDAMKEDTVMIVKYHYLVMDKIDWSPYKGFIYAYDMTYDISDMYLVSDMMITDYSSVMFDYSLLRRPMLFYCYDLEAYAGKLRGFYFDFIREAPGPILTSTPELITAIKEFKEDAYKEKYEAFHQKYNHADNGNASKTIVSLVEQMVQEKI